VIKRFLLDDTGLELTEYAMAAALVTLAVVASISTLGTNITSVIGNLASYIK
jgi:pilus assembly protein Flp/PilA